MSDDEAQLVSLVQQAGEIESPDKQAEFLKRSCAGRPGLRDRLQAILNAMPAENGTTEAGVNNQPSAKHSPPPLSSEHSVIYSLGSEIRPPSVVLDDSLAQGSEPIVQPTSTEIPKTIESSRYQLQGEIARGGMGAVLKGRDVDLGRNLAIKILLDEHKQNPVVIRRFIEEAQIGGQLQHPGIAPVYELGQFEDQRPFFTMKLVKGETLAYMLMGRRTLRQNRAKLLGIFEQVCQTMAYAHNRRVIHRDLKPANIMVGAFGEVQVMDWGLAKVLPADGQPSTKPAPEPHDGKSMIATFRSAGSDVPLPNVGSVEPVGSNTQMGSAMGTPAYMPPEQALGEVDRMDRRSDVFGLGAILCEILTGEPPYIADDIASMMRLACRGKTDECFERLEHSDADEQLIQLTKRCLAFELDDRPRDAAEVSECITQYLQSVEDQVKQTEIRRAEEEARSTEERKRRKVAWSLAASVLVTIALGAGGWMWNTQQVAKRQQADQQQFDRNLNDARVHQELAEDENLALRKSELELAIKATQSAIKLAAQSELPAEVTQPAEALGKQLQADLAATTDAIAAQDRNQKLKEQLELIRVRHAAVSKRNETSMANADREFLSTDQSYRTAFVSAGVDFETESDEQIVAWASLSPIRASLIAALDHWASCFPERSSDELIDAYLSIGDWKRVAQLGQQAIDEKPGDSGNWLRTAPALVLSNQADEYTRLCRQMCDQFVSSKSLNDTDRVVKVCLLVPDAIDLETIPTEILEKEVDERKIPVGWHWASRGLLALRRGRPKQAYEYLLEVEAADPGPLAKSYCHALKSLVESELGEHQKALASLNRTRQSLHEILDDATKRSSLDAAFAMIHFREAETKRKDVEPDARIAKFLAEGLGPTAYPMELRQIDRKRRLHHLVQTIDDDPFRSAVRQAVADSDIDQVLKLASKKQVKNQSSAFVAWLGAMLRSVEQVDQAIEVLNAAQQITPDDLQLNLELSQCFQVTGNASEALDYARAAYALHPTSEATQWLLAMTLADAQRDDESERVFVRLLQRTNKENDDLLLLARRLEAQGRHTHAKLAAEAAITLDEQRAMAYEILCRALKGLGDTEGALAAGLRACELAPDKYRPHYALGHVYMYSVKDYEKAVEAYSRAAELIPTGSIVHYQLAVALESAGRRDESLATLRRSLELDPKNSVARNRLGRMLMSKALTKSEGTTGRELDQVMKLAGNPMEARVDALIEALEVRPRDVAKRNELAALLIQMKRYDEAEKHLKVLLEIDPDNVTALISGAVSSTEQQHYEDAVRMLEKAISHDSGNAAAHVRLGIALEAQIDSPSSSDLTDAELGLLDRAIDAYRTAYDISPKHRRARRALINALQRGGHAGQAEKYIAAVESLDDKEAVAQLVREASWLWDAKQFAEVQTVCEEVLKRDPNHVAAHLYLVDGCMYQGKFSDSLRYAKRLAQLKPESENAHRAVGELQLLCGQTEAAITTFRRVLAMNPKALMVRSDIAQALYEMGRREEAIAECRAGIAHDPQDMFSRAALAFVIAMPTEMQDRQESLQEALRQAQVAYKSIGSQTVPRFAMIYAEALGTVLYRLGRYEEAAEVFGEYPRLRDGEPVGLLLAMAHFQLGNEMQAREIYERTLADFSKLERLTQSQKSLMHEAKSIFSPTNP